MTGALSATWRRPPCRCVRRRHPHRAGRAPEVDRGVAARRGRQPQRGGRDRSAASPVDRCPSGPRRRGGGGGAPAVVGATALDAAVVGATSRPSPPPGESVATTVARGSLLVTPSAEQHAGGRQRRGAHGRRRCAGDVARHHGRARSASVVVATASPAWSAHRGHRHGHHPDERQADGAVSHDQQASATGRRLVRWARQLGRVAPRPLVRGQRCVRHRIANLPRPPRP